MGRAPCCEKMGMKKGPWSPQEDHLLISYIHQHGHSNWRALPKQAGLLRCGKSCRLRWTNYLRPDIKRGNFSKEEEDTIIQLHEELGNRWSAIAAKLPGRTDNEIKNVWHTHLKKRLENHHINNSATMENSISVAKRSNSSNQSKSDNLTPHSHKRIESPFSPQQSTSEISTVTDVTVLPNRSIKDEEMEISENFPIINESFWSDEFSTADLSSRTEEFETKFPSSPVREELKDYTFKVDDGVDFWYNLFIRAHGGLPELPEF